MPWVILDCKTRIHLKDIHPKQTKCNLPLHYQRCLPCPMLSEKYPVHPFSLIGKKIKDSRPWKVLWLLIEEQIWIVRSMWHKLTVCFLLKEEETTMGFRTSVVLEQHLLGAVTEKSITKHQNYPFCSKIIYILQNPIPKSAFQRGEFKSRIVSLIN